MCHLSHPQPSPTAATERPGDTVVAVLGSIYQQGAEVCIYKNESNRTVIIKICFLNWMTENSNTFKGVGGADWMLQSYAVQ